MKKRKKIKKNKTKKQKRERKKQIEKRKETRRKGQFMEGSTRLDRQIAGQACKGGMR